MTSQIEHPSIEHSQLKHRFMSNVDWDDIPKYSDRDIDKWANLYCSNPRINTEMTFGQFMVMPMEIVNVVEHIKTYELDRESLQAEQDKHRQPLAKRVIERSTL